MIYANDIIKKIEENKDDLTDDCLLEIASICEYIYMDRHFGEL